MNEERHSLMLGIIMDAEDVQFVPGAPMIVGRCDSGEWSAIGDCVPLRFKIPKDGLAAAAVAASCGLLLETTGGILARHRDELTMVAARRVTIPFVQDILPYLDEKSRQDIDRSLKISGIPEGIERTEQLSLFFDENWRMGEHQMGLLLVPDMQDSVGIFHLGVGPVDEDGYLCGEWERMIPAAPTNLESHWKVCATGVPCWECDKEGRFHVTRIA